MVIGFFRRNSVDSNVCSSYENAIRVLKSLESSYVSVLSDLSSRPKTKNVELSRKRKCVSGVCSDRVFEIALELWMRRFQRLGAVEVLTYWEKRPPISTADVTEFSRIFSPAIHSEDMFSFVREHSASYETVARSQARTVPSHGPPCRPSSRSSVNASPGDRMRASTRPRKATSEDVDEDRYSCVDSFAPTHNPKAERPLFHDVGYTGPIMSETMSSGAWMKTGPYPTFPPLYTGVEIDLRNILPFKSGSVCFARSDLGNIYLY